MKKTGLALFVLTMLCNIIFASPVLTKSKYLISVLSEDGNGAVTPGTVNYPLIYNTDLNNETATDADYWIIKKQAITPTLFRISLQKSISNMTFMPVMTARHWYWLMQSKLINPLPLH